MKNRILSTTLLTGALVLGGVAVTQGAVAAPPDDPGNASCAGRGLPEAKIGVQQFTYLPTLFGGGTAEDVTAHMAEVGMRNVERFGGTFGMTLEDYDAMWDEYNVRPVASHGSLDLATWDQTLADAKLLGQKYVGSGGFGGPGFATLEDTLQTAANLNELGMRAHHQGLRLTVHNHDAEFTTMYPYDIDGDGDLEQTPMVEIVLANTDPRYVSLELDVHWARVGLAGGRTNNPDLAANLADPSNQDMLIDWIDEHADRIALMHVKDTAPNGAIATVGQGTTDWGDVFTAATSVKYYFVEHDFPASDVDTVQAAWDYLTCLNY